MAPAARVSSSDGWSRKGRTPGRGPRRAPRHRARRSLGRGAILRFARRHPLPHRARARLASSPETPDALDEGGGRTVQPVRAGLTAEHRRELDRKLLPELDTPLVEGVDPPHDALREDDMLVEGDERPQCEGREPL